MKAGVGEIEPSPLSSTYKAKDFLTVGIISALYLILSYFLLGYKQDQLVLVLIFSISYLASAATRKFILGFAIFIIYWIIYDYMKAFPNYAFNEVHIQNLFEAEKSIFGIHHEDTIITPNQYWALHGNSFLDVLCGIFYLCWIPVPLAFAGYLFYKDRKWFLHFALTFLLVNLLGFVVYYTYPAAPPWYSQVHGLIFDPNTPGNTAGLSKFDQFFGVTVFQSLYAKGSNVFAAMPSLHSAYPLIVLYYGIRSKLGKINILFAIVTVGIWFAAIYTSHHYTLDVLAGITTAAIGITLFHLLLKNNRLQHGFQRYLAAIR